MSQKILFNDKFRLTQAVLEGRKTMTRRIAYDGTLDNPKVVYDEKTSKLSLYDGKRLISISRYHIGELISVAQSYETMANSGYLDIMLDDKPLRFKKEYVGAGYTNKMFTKADLLPHKIKITDIKVERLQDISDEDCLKEGVSKLSDSYRTTASDMFFHTAQEAFAVLIDKVSGKGTLKRNPFVFAYTFELVK